MYTIIELKFRISVLEQKVGSRAETLKMLVRKANRVDLIRLLLQKQSDLGLPYVGSISSQLLMELTKWLLEITEV